MTPTGFIIGQDESRCYVKLSFKFIFFNIFFIQLIVNIDCDVIIENLDNSEDHYGCAIQKIVILQVIQQTFFEMLISGRNVFTLIRFLKSLISGQMFKIILQSLKGYFKKWCRRNHLRSKKYVILMGILKGNDAMCLLT